MVPRSNTESLEDRKRSEKTNKFSTITTILQINTNKDFPKIDMEYQGCRKLNKE